MFRQIIQLIRDNYKSVVLVFSTLLLMVIVSFQTSSSIVSSQLQVLGQETLKKAETNVSASLLESQTTFANIGLTVDSMIRNGKSNGEILAFLTDMNIYFHSDKSPLPDFLKIYAQLNGEFLDGSAWTPPADYVPEQRPWYIGAEATHDVYFSEPYTDADTGDICISFSQSIHNPDNEIVGVLAIDLSISRIINYMENLEFGNGSYGMVINNNLEFMGHKHPELTGVSLEAAGEQYRPLANRMKAYEEITALRLRDIDGTDCVAFFSPIFNGWYLGLLIPRSSYYAPVYQLAAVLGIIGLVLASVLSGLLLRTRYERMISLEESRSKSNFLSRMSHEMRTPMNAIIGMANLAGKTDDIEEIRYCLSQIDIASGHLLGIINDVLDISKIESGKLTISETDFILEKMLRRVTSVIKHSIEEKSLDFNITLAPDMPYSIVSDEQRLSQVITNLLSNAVKFTPDKGTIELKVSKLEESAEGCLLHIEIKDSGIGIEPQLLEKLFQPFQQADNTISRRYGGTGLGLAISKSIVERLDGAIWAESAPGSGSSFLFTVPVRYGSQKHMQLSPATPWKSLRLLVIDKQPEILRFMEEFALLSGVTCRKASTSDEALKLIKQEQTFNLAFVDYHLLDISSLELCRNIRDISPSTKCILMASHSEWLTVEKEATESSIHTYLEKPLLPSAIADCIAESCSDFNHLQTDATDTAADITGIFAGRTILVAEDVEINAEILMALLEETGVEIKWVQNGQLVCEAFASEPERFHLILMDIHMPELDGYEATRKIRALDCPQSTAIPIVAMTANVFQEDIDHCLQAGMNDHIGKPLDLDEVIATLKRYM